MQEDIFQRRYSNEFLEDVDYIIPEPILGTAARMLETPPYMRKKVDERVQGDSKCSIYLVQGGITRLNMTMGHVRSIELITESAQGLACLAEEFGLPLRESEKPVPKRGSKQHICL